MPNEEKIKEYFEANFLDGDKINDCGGATFTVSGALDVAEFFFNFGKQQTLKEAIAVVLNYTADLCENSQEFKDYLISNLQALKDKN